MLKNFVYESKPVFTDPCSMETLNKEMFVLPVFSLSALLHVMSTINQILIKS